MADVETIGNTVDLPPPIPSDVSGGTSPRNSEAAPLSIQADAEPAKQGDKGAASSTAGNSKHGANQSAPKGDKGDGVSERDELEPLAKEIADALASENFLTRIACRAGLDMHGPISRHVGTQIGGAVLLLIVQFFVDLFAWSIAFGWVFSEEKYPYLYPFLTFGMAAAISTVVLLFDWFLISAPMAPGLFGWLRPGFLARIAVAFLFSSIVAIPIELLIMQEQIDTRFEHLDKEALRNAVGSEVQRCKDNIAKGSRNLEGEGPSRGGGNGKPTTDAPLTVNLMDDPKVIDAKNKLTQAETAYKKLVVPQEDGKVESQKDGPSITACKDVVGTKATMDTLRVFHLDVKGKALEFEKEHEVLKIAASNAHNNARESAKKCKNAQKSSKPSPEPAVQGTERAKTDPCSKFETDSKAAKKCQSVLEQVRTEGVSLSAAKSNYDTVYSEVYSMHTTDSISKQAAQGTMKHNQDTMTEQRRINSLKACELSIDPSMTSILQRYESTPDSKEKKWTGTPITDLVKKRKADAEAAKKAEADNWYIAWADLTPVQVEFVTNTRIRVPRDLSARIAALDVLTTDSSGGQGSPESDGDGRVDWRAEQQAMAEPNNRVKWGIRILFMALAGLVVIAKLWFSNATRQYFRYGKDPILAKEYQPGSFTF